MTDYYLYGFPKDESDAFEKAKDDEVNNQAELNKIGAKVEKEQVLGLPKDFVKLSAHRQLGLELLMYLNKVFYIIHLKLMAF